MILQVAVGCCVCFLYVIWHIQDTQRTRRKLNYPPGPYDLPFLGSVIQLLWTVGIHGQHYEKFHRFSQKYGKFAFARAGVLNLVFTEDFEGVKEVLNSPDWAYRFPNHPRFREHTLSKNLGLMFSEAGPHREMRKFTIRRLRTFGFGERRATDEFIQDETNDLFKWIDTQRSIGKIQDEVFMHHLFKAPTFNMLWRVMAGERFSCDDPKIQALANSVEELANINIGLGPEWLFPPLRFIPALSPSRAKAKYFDICHEFFANIIKERREKSTYKDVQLDFMDYFLYKIDEEKSNVSTYYTDEQFQITCTDLLFGGIDTTANSLEFAILYLTKFPSIQRKVQVEIDTIIGSDRSPGVSDEINLKYSEAVMLETLRFGSIIPMLARTASCDTTIGPYNVKKNTLCALNMTLVHMSEEVWGDPHTFRPERFLDENSNIINSDKIFSFGGGKRHCPGYKMSKVIWMSIFTSLLQRYDFHPSPEHPELSIIPVAGVANTPLKFYCQVTKRNQRIATVTA